ncbi:Starch-binding associating with outer membrane [Draconibacterium orientale]|uniref:RagB/SusD family protein n=1 Tax=Draconibacterium orientale TaxID=1168034 RepID=X5D826_9BACT|nr:RagB/SusD family nutrient uptake outer membrane protein [Draconibacterium orientale]AHW58848.1 RagB/SusD family protein [Draconibacterium orientale]SET93639.1 Starch-binding associating with outer membrane [Draconibacterium orientale]
MKTLYKLKNILIAFIAILLLHGCESILEEPVQSQFASENLLSTKKGIESLMADAYARNNNVIMTRDVVKREEMTADILWQSGGGENGTAAPLIGFRWDPSSTLEAFDWMNYWQVIRDANIILESVDNVSDFNNEQDKNQIVAEARFLRVWSYYQLWNQYGPMPLRKSQADELELPRATNEEFASFVEAELKEIIPILPEPGDEPAYGRHHKGGAQALLCIWYLNSHQWQNCADIAQDIISDGYFSLYPDYNDMFALENEQNEEFILVKTKLANAGNNNTLWATAAPSFPAVYKEGLDGGLEGVVNEKWSNFASNYRLYDSFYNSFEANDQRKGRILTRYIDTQGNTVNLLDYTDCTRAMKYPPDPDASGSSHGNDVPMIRYAEILLSRAEALNELNGPTQESVDLVNQIRTRAGLENKSLTDLGSKDLLREQILNERLWEFWYEGKRRRDLIRTGQYIENAQSRGITNATANHVWFPIPQSAIDANPLLEQNPGY